MHNTLREKMTRVLVQDMGVLVESPTQNLFEAGALDSLSFVNLLLYIESEFGLEIAFETLDLDRFSSIDGICRYIREETADRVVRLLPGRGA